MMEGLEQGKVDLAVVCRIQLDSMESSEKNIALVL